MDVPALQRGIAGALTLVAVRALNQALVDPLSQSAPICPAIEDLPNQVVEAVSQQLLQYRPSPCPVPVTPAVCEVEKEETEPPWVAILCSLSSAAATWILTSVWPCLRLLRRLPEEPTFEDGLRDAARPRGRPRAGGRGRLE